MIEGVAEVSAARGLLSKQRGFSQGDVHNMMVELAIDDGRRVELIEEWEQIVLGWPGAVRPEAWRDVSLTYPILRAGLLAGEYNDCAFAIVQYRSHTFIPAPFSRQMPMISLFPGTLSSSTGKLLVQPGVQVKPSPL
jgi:hypothetical protein